MIDDPAVAAELAAIDEERRERDGWAWVKVAGILLNVAVAVLAVAVVGFVGWNTYRLRDLTRQNRIGVERIVGCTTPGRPCFTDAKVRSDAIIADVVARLDRQHRVLECLVLIRPAEATPENLAQCRIAAAAAQGGSD
ncbi:MAG: hypothetical protein ACRDYV_20840 [Acidimicrobiia bacterium]